MGIVALIPVRMKSDHFPEKCIHPFLNKPVLGHIIENCQKIGFINKIVVLTEDKIIENYIKENYSYINVEYVYGCRCETEMLFRYYLKYRDDDYYILIPSNDPSINPSEINNIWQKIPKRKNEIITFYTQFFCLEDLESPLSCKIISNHHDYMIYNSRAIIPTNKIGEVLSLNNYKKHVGVFIFPKEILEKEGRPLWGNWKSNSADLTGLEQNRFIDHGLKIKMYRIKHIGFGIDVPEQIEILERRINSKGNDNGYRFNNLQRLSEDLN